MACKICRGAICSITRVVNTPAKETVIEYDDRERPFPNRDLHHAGDRKFITGIIDQIRSKKFVFIQCGADMNCAAVVLMLTKPVNRVWKDQFFYCWGCRRSERKTRD